MINLIQSFLASLTEKTSYIDVGLYLLKMVRVD